LWKKICHREHRAKKENTERISLLVFALVLLPLNFLSHREHRGKDENTEKYFSSPIRVICVIHGGKFVTEHTEN
jgi:hypothetical protein